ncbi:MAG: OmpA family protein [Bacteroidota bacterium]
MRSNRILLAVFAACLTASCVPSRMFDEMKTSKLQCDEENAKLKADMLAANTRISELDSRNSELDQQNKYLRNDTTSMGEGTRRLTKLYNELSDSYDKLSKNNEKMLASGQSENRKLISQLNQTQEELQRKEDALAARERELNETSAQLKLREARVAELQQVLDSKDSAVKALKETVTKALLGFQGQGLTVEQKNGKVYVSLEERLLFASGSTVVDPKGEDALKELGNVLAKNTDINVLIEGHTDNVPIKGGAIKDNWDLSVLRATSVVRILEKNKGVAPVRLTPAGRGEYMPIDKANTADARKKNRRIEVILTPKLDELFQVLESN